MAAYMLTDRQRDMYNTYRRLEAYRRKLDLMVQRGTPISRGSRIPMTAPAARWALRAVRKQQLDRLRWPNYVQVRYAIGGLRYDHPIELMLRWESFDLYASGLNQPAMYRPRIDNVYEALITLWRQRGDNWNHNFVGHDDIEHVATFFVHYLTEAPRVPYPSLASLTQGEAA